MCIQELKPMIEWVLNRMVYRSPKLMKRLKCVPFPMLMLMDSIEIRSGEYNI